MLVSKVAEICSVLSHPARHDILKAIITSGPDGITQRRLIMKVALSRIAVKRHIDQLVKVDIVNLDKQERALIYRANPNKLKDYLESLRRSFEINWVLRETDEAPSDQKFESLRDRLKDVVTPDDATNDS